MKGAPTVAPVENGDAMTGAAVTVGGIRARVQLRDIKGNTITMPMPDGSMKPFQLVIVPAEYVDRKTMVSPHNERDQQLLTRNALRDILPSVELYGVTEPVMARECMGVYEIAKGSRRRASAILAGKDLPVLVGDLSDDDVIALDRVSNHHLKPSPWERGRRYTRLCDRGMGLREVENWLADIGEKVSRRDISRCINTYLLPDTIIAAFDCPNDLSARAGDELGKLWAKASDELKTMWNQLSEELRAGKHKDDEWDADKTVAAFKALKVGANGGLETKAQAKASITSWGKGRVKLTHKGNKATLQLTNIDEKVVAYIGRIISGELRLPMDEKKAESDSNANDHPDLKSLEYGEGWRPLLENPERTWLEEAWGKYRYAIEEYKHELKQLGATEEEIEMVEELAEERFRGETNPKVLLNIREVRAVVRHSIEELALPCWQNR